MAFAREAAHGVVDGEALERAQVPGHVGGDPAPEVGLTRPALRSNRARVKAPRRRSLIWSVSCSVWSSRPRREALGLVDRGPPPRARRARATSALSSASLGFGPSWFRRSRADSSGASSRPMIVRISSVTGPTPSRIGRQLRRAEIGAGKLLLARGEVVLGRIELGPHRLERLGHLGLRGRAWRLRAWHLRLGICRLGICRLGVRRLAFGRLRLRGFGVGRLGLVPGRGGRRGRLRPAEAGGKQERRQPGGDHRADRTAQARFAGDSVARGRATTYRNPWMLGRGRGRGHG